MKRDLILLFVAFHPLQDEVEQLAACLSCLPPQIGYAMAINDYCPGEAVEQLTKGADHFLCNSDNPGYGRAVNRLVSSLDEIPDYLGILNTDLSWCSGTFETILLWMQNNSDVSLAVPQILDPLGEPQKLCKQSPTVLGLFSRRFVPEVLKPSCLKRYDRWYVMDQFDYQNIFEVPYLSGCCMVVRSESFLQVGGFDERYFLYLEDADLTRALAYQGRCLHFPEVSVVHQWGKGNYQKFSLMIINIISAWRYFAKWGWKLW
ncbi:glycosyltransferase [Prochlorococcus marinus str. MIT 9313]|uniref:Glycosyltransferase n=1 Tax=Prochlorococcus marinus (strain MIT 9313) TaxID=74547 RepID=Q7V973_PROMM|nr:glycosyltransferase family 2 protein [Prochlorococcus marinus]CAE20260.1 glycosyltransferase [Prochlorococcus marinus str. MIT 9313]